MTTPRLATVDLHCHTARSDGVLEPLELFDQLRGCGMALVAITDHDTLAGYVELRELDLGTVASERGPRLIAGVEINGVGGPTLGRRSDDPQGQGHELHILGLGVDPQDAALGRALADQRRRRRDRAEEVLQRLDELGLAVRAHLPVIPGGIESMGRPHVARALVEAGHASSVNDAFERHLDVGRPAYVPRAGMGPRDAIEVIRAAGGVASLAHSASAPDRPTEVGALVEWGLTALECFHPSFDDATATRMVAFAAAHHLLPTGGSDYHGDAMDYRTARQSATPVPDWVGQGLLDVLASSA